jgi:prepilin-type N-terminal cleavage/methylation domain-containing protein
MRRSGCQEATAAVSGSGFTVVELMVVLAIFGLTLGVSGLAVASFKAPHESAWIREMRRARVEAIRTGVPTRAVIPSPTSTGLHQPPPLLFLPDGRAIGADADPLTGVARDSGRSSR